MLAILLFHTEAYYNDGREIIPYNLYVANVLTAFFFLSGYLFHNGERPFSLAKKLLSIVRGIILPYFFFTLLLAFPKALMTDLSFKEVIVNILEGKGSWFVAALAVAEIEFSFAMMLRRHWSFHILPWIAIILAFLLTGNLDNEHNYWKVHNALIAFLFLYLGHMYRRYEQQLQFLKTHTASLLCLLLLIVIKVYVQQSHQSWVIDGVEVTCYPLFLVDMLLGICLMRNIIAQLPRLAFLHFVGIHSLLYYFFCGAVPMAVTSALRHFSFDYDGQYWHIIVAFLLVCLISSLIVWMFSFFFVLLQKITNR